MQQSVIVIVRSSTPFANRHQQAATAGPEILNLNSNLNTQYLGQLLRNRLGMARACSCGEALVVEAHPRATDGTAGWRTSGGMRG